MVANASAISCNLSCANAYDVAHGAHACAQLLSESGYSCDAHFCPSCQYRNFCDRICDHQCKDVIPINISECELPQEPRAAFWNTTSLEWHVGGTFNSSTQSKRAIVGFNHLTDFAVILDDPPATNKLASLRDTFDLSGWLQNNPVGLVLVVCFLAMIAIVATKNQRLYMQRNRLCLADQPWWHCRCSRHESTELQQAAILNTDYASSMYRYLKAVNEMDSIEYRLVQLRNNWNLGAILCPIPGDPHSRVERMWCTRQC